MVYLNIGNSPPTTIRMTISKCMDDHFIIKKETNVV